jgi:hypothetical protein
LKINCVSQLCFQLCVDPTYRASMRQAESPMVKAEALVAAEVRARKRLQDRSFISIRLSMPQDILCVVRRGKEKDLIVN